MTHEELDRLGPELQKRCNDEIARRFPTWSRYAVGQMLDQTMSDLAPDWGWMKVSTVSGVPEIRLMQYHGNLQPHGGSDGY